MILSILKDKKKKRSRRSYLIGQLDSITSKLVRTRDGYRCRKCGKLAVIKGDVAHHHIFTKTRFPTRWMPENGVCLCFRCHRWAHSAGEEFRRWVVSWMGQAEYDQLYLWSQTRGGFREWDMEMMLKEARGSMGNYE